MKTKLSIVLVMLVTVMLLLPAQAEDDACLRTLVPTMRPDDPNGLRWCFDFAPCGGGVTCMVDEYAARHFPWLMSTAEPIAYPWPVTVVEQAPYPAPDDEQLAVQVWRIVTRHGRGKP